MASQEPALVTSLTRFDGPGRHPSSRSVTSTMGLKAVVILAVFARYSGPPWWHHLVGTGGGSRVGLGTDLMGAGVVRAAQARRGLAGLRAGSSVEHDLEDIKQLGPDLIVLDYRWTHEDTSGSLLQRLRLDPGTKDTPRAAGRCLRKISLRQPSSP